jgi:hypothetical protein
MAILREHPPTLLDVNPQLSPGLARIVERCLEKNPSARFQSIQDLAFALEDLSTRTDVAAAAKGEPRRSLAWLPWALLMLTVSALAVAFVLMFTYYRAARDASRPIRFLIVPPPQLTFTHSAIANFVAVSPDGRQVAFGGTNAAGMPAIWIREMDSLEARPLPGTDAGRNPFWSPDGRFVAFFAYGLLKRVPVGGGPAQILCPTTAVPTAGSWGPDGVILFSSLSGPIRKVPAAGGESTPATALSPAADERHSFPHFLPDGRRFLFYIEIR